MYRSTVYIILCLDKNACLCRELVSEEPDYVLS